VTATNRWRQSRRLCVDTLYYHSCVFSTQTFATFAITAVACCTTAVYPLCHMKPIKRKLHVWTLSCERGNSPFSHKLHFTNTFGFASPCDISQIGKLEKAAQCFPITAYLAQSEIRRASSTQSSLDSTAQIAGVLVRKVFGLFGLAINVLNCGTWRWCGACMITCVYQQPPTELAVQFTRNLPNYTSHLTRSLGYPFKRVNIRRTALTWINLNKKKNSEELLQIDGMGNTWLSASSRRTELLSPNRYELYSRRLSTRAGPISVEVCPIQTAVEPFKTRRLRVAQPQELCGGAAGSSRWGCIPLVSLYWTS